MERLSTLPAIKDLFPGMFSFVLILLSSEGSPGCHQRTLCRGRKRAIRRPYVLAATTPVVFFVIRPSSDPFCLRAANRTATPSAFRPRTSERLTSYLRHPSSVEAAADGSSTSGAAE